MLGRDFVPEGFFTAAKNGGYVAVLLAGVWACRTGFIRSWQVTKSNHSRAIAMVVVGVVLMGVASAVGQLASLGAGTPGAGENQAAISAEVLTASSSLPGAVFFIGLGGLVAPIVEELIFRELPLRRRRGTLATVIATSFSSLVFAAIHVRGWEEWPLMILYAGFGLALATVYVLSRRNLLVSISVHVLWNGFGLTYLIVTAAIA